MMCSSEFHPFMCWSLIHNKQFFKRRLTLKWNSFTFLETKERENCQKHLLSKCFDDVCVSTLVVLVLKHENTHLMMTHPLNMVFMCLFFTFFITLSSYKSFHIISNRMVLKCPLSAQIKGYFCPQSV